MGFTAAVRNDMLDDLDTLATHASLHTADPGDTGADELAGGSYTRQPITWQPAAAGSKTITAVATFQIPPGATITHGGTWSAASGGLWRGGEALDEPQPYPTGGTYQLTLTAVLA